MDIGAVEIRKWHTAPPPAGRGWNDIGYHFVIRRNGSVEDGRSIDVIGAHCEGRNATSIGVCMVGGIDHGGKAENNFTPEQWKALVYLLKVLKKQFPDASIHGHRDFSPKDCPSFDVHDWLKTVQI